jgi:hypothetical protein
MKNPDVEAHLRNAVKNTVPDVLNNILSQCDDRKGKVVEMKTKDNKTKFGWVKPLASIAAAIALLVGTAFGTSYYQKALAVYSVVTLDVNPSIEIEANKNDVVLAVRGLNEDGENLLSGQEMEGKKLKGEDLETVAKELASKMAEEGYLTEMKNSLLVSVQNPNAEKSEELENILMEEIKEALAEKGIDGAVLGQTLTENENLKTLAEELGISLGKTEFISSIIESYSELSYEDLARLSINELLLIAGEGIKDNEGINLIGTPSDKEYLNAKIAIEDTCVNAGLTLGEELNTEISFAYSEGKLVYDVRVNIGDTELNCNVDAKSVDMEELISAISKVAVDKIEQRTQNSGKSGISNDYEKVFTETIGGAINKATENVKSGSSEQGPEQGPKQDTPNINDTISGIISSGIDYFKNSFKK